MLDKSKLLLIAVLSVGVGLAAALGVYQTVLNAETSAQGRVDGGVDTSAAIAGAAWSPNVSITLNKAENSFRYVSDGLPATYMADQYLVPDSPSMMPFSRNPKATFWTLDKADIKPTPIDKTITTLPIYSEQTVDTTLGPIGVAINGAWIFNDYEDPGRSIVALDDNVIHDHAAFVDECNGHPLGDGTTYHYHGVPVCLSAEIDVEGEHSAMIGVLQDGFPVYANQGENGVLMVNADLDECGGHFGPTPEFPDGVYHYHLTADEAPYSIDCYHGEVELAAMRRGPPGPPDLSGAAEALGVSEAVLRDALGGRPPNFEAAAEVLGVSVERLQALLPPPPPPR